MTSNLRSEDFRLRQTHVDKFCHAAPPTRPIFLAIGRAQRENLSTLGAGQTGVELNQQYRRNSWKSRVAYLF